MNNYSGSGCIGVLLAVLVLLAAASVVQERCTRAPEPAAQPFSVARAPLTPEVPRDRGPVVPIPSTPSPAAYEVGEALTAALRVNEELRKAASACFDETRGYTVRPSVMGRYVDALRRRNEAAERVAEAMRSAEPARIAECSRSLELDVEERRRADEELTQAMRELENAQDHEKMAGVRRFASAGSTVAYVEADFYRRLRQCMR